MIIKVTSHDGTSGWLTLQYLWWVQPRWVQPRWEGDWIAMGCLWNGRVRADGSVDWGIM